MLAKVEDVGNCLKKRIVEVECGNERLFKAFYTSMPALVLSVIYM